MYKNILTLFYLIKVLIMKILYFKDSIAIGIGGTVGNSYPDILAFYL